MYPVFLDQEQTILILLLLFVFLFGRPSEKKAQDYVVSNRIGTKFGKIVLQLFASIE